MHIFLHHRPQIYPQLYQETIITISDTVSVERLLVKPLGPAGLFTTSAMVFPAQAPAPVHTPARLTKFSFHTFSYSSQFLRIRAFTLPPATRTFVSNRMPPPKKAEKKAKSPGLFASMFSSPKPSKPGKNVSVSSPGVDPGHLLHAQAHFSGVACPNNCETPLHVFSQCLETW